MPPWAGVPSQAPWAGGAPIQAPWAGDAARASDTSLAPCAQRTVSAPAAVEPEPAAQDGPAPPRQPPQAWSIDLVQLDVPQPPFRRPATPPAVGRRKRPSSPPITVFTPARPPPPRAASPPASDDVDVEPTRADNRMHQPLEDSRAAAPSTAADLQADLGGTRPAWAAITASVDPAVGFDSPAPAAGAAPAAQFAAVPAALFSPPHEECRPWFNSSHPASGTKNRSVGAYVADSEVEAASVLDAIDSFLAGDLAHHFMSGSA